MKKISLVLFAGMCILLSAQFCNAQLSVFGYNDFDDVVGWKVGANNSGCQRARAAEEDYYRRGGKQIGLQRFSGLQQQCGDNQYGCYALVKGFNTNPSTNVKRAVYSFISGGADTKEEAERRATDSALYNVLGADRGTISVLTSGCIAKPSSPSQPANPSANWSGWVTGGDCFRKVSYRYMSRELVDLNYQFHYYFEARNDYPETIFFILSLKDASGRERFGTRHTIAPGQTIKFAEKMDKNYIKTFAIEKVRFKSDTGDYAACDDERNSSKNTTSPSKPAPAKDTTTPKQVDVSLPTAPANNAAAIKQKIVENLRTNIRPFRFEQRTTIGIPNVIAISNISVDLNENGIAVRYTLRKEGGIYLGTTGSRPGWNGYESGWSEWQLVETIPFDRLFSTLQVDTDHRNAFLLKNSTNRVVNAFGKEEVIGQTTGGAWDRGSPGQVYGQMALIYYDAGPGGQNFNDLKALAQQLSGEAPSGPGQNTASNTAPQNTNGSTVQDAFYSKYTGDYEAADKSVLLRIQVAGDDLTVKAFYPGEGSSKQVPLKRVSGDSFLVGPVTLAFYGNQILWSNAKTGNLVYYNRLSKPFDETKLSVSKEKMTATLAGIWDGDNGGTGMIEMTDNGFNWKNQGQGFSSTFKKISSDSYRFDDGPNFCIVKLLSETKLDYSCNGTHYAYFNRRK